MTATTPADRGPRTRGTALKAYRDLAFTLMKREIVVRYKRSVMGVLWALIEPVANVAVYLVVFGIFLDAGRGTEDYAVFAIWGVLPWLFFSSTIEQSSFTLLEHAALLKKASFPRELLIAAVTTSRLTTLLLGIIPALLFSVARGVVPTPADLVALLIGLIAITVSAYGLGLVLSALQVLLRDILFLVRFGLRLGFYACPIIYPLSRIPDDLRGAYELNPLVGLLWCFQSAGLSASAQPSSTAFISTAIFVLISGPGGWLLFRRLRRAVGDRL